MHRKILFAFAGVVVFAVALGVTSRLTAQPEIVVYPAGKCVGVAVFVPPEQGYVKIVRAWEDGSLDTRSYRIDGGALGEWKPLR